VPRPLPRLTRNDCEVTATLRRSGKVLHDQYPTIPDIEWHAGCAADMGHANNRKLLILWRPNSRHLWKFENSRPTVARRLGRALVRRRKCA
jgi:hypothetical protein